MDWPQSETLDNKKLHMRNSLLSIFLITGLISWNSCYYDSKEALLEEAGGCDTSAVSFSIEINPVIISKCNSCHGGTSPSAGISTEGYANILTIVNNGKLWGSVNHLSGFSPMPVGSSKLESCYLQKLNAWIAAGAPNN